MKNKSPGRPTKYSDEMTRTNVYLPKSLKEKLKNESQKTGRDMAVIVREAIEEKLERDSKSSQSIAPQ